MRLHDVDIRRTPICVEPRSTLWRCKEGGTAFHGRAIVEAKEYQIITNILSNHGYVKSETVTSLLCHARQLELK